MAGILLAYICAGNLHSRTRGTSEPVVVTLDILGQPGPIDNVHVTVTQFRAGEVTLVKAGKGKSRHGWVPLLKPDGSWPVRPVFAFAFVVADEHEAATRINRATLTGILATDGLPRYARQQLESLYPGVDFSAAIYLHVGASWPSLPWNIGFLTLGLMLITAGCVMLWRQGVREKPAEVVSHTGR